MSFTAFDFAFPCYPFLEGRWLGQSPLKLSWDFSACGMFRITHETCEAWANFLDIEESQPVSDLVQVDRY